MSEVRNFNFINMGKAAGLRRLALTIGISCAAGVAVAQQPPIVCDLVCAQEALSDPKSMTAMVMVDEALLVQSLMKECDNLRVQPANKDSYAFFIENAPRVLGENHAVGIANREEMAKQKVSLFGCADTASLFGSARYAASVVGARID